MSHTIVCGTFYDVFVLAVTCVSELRIKSHVVALTLTHLQCMLNYEAPFTVCMHAQAINVVLHGAGNWVVAAPTNSGKTAIFIELSK